MDASDSTRKSKDNKIFEVQAYADEVFSKHKLLKEFINEDCMVWFLNPHVKKVIIPSVFHSERVVEQLKMIGPGITSLNLHKSKMSETELNSVICCLPHVVHLDLSETSCSNNTLAHIVKSCPDLESLNASWCEKITDKGMKILCDSQLSLKSLNLWYSGVNYHGIASILNKMESLKYVKYEDLSGLLYDIGKGKQYNITELIDDTTLCNSVKKMKAFVRICPKLEKISLEFKNSIKIIKVLKLCANFQNLRELKIKLPLYYDSSVKADVLTPILPIARNLKTLALSCLEISVLTLVENFSNLENLYLKKVSFTPFEKDNITITETNLATLVLKNIDMEIHDAAYEAVTLLISLSKNIIKLNLTYNVLPDEIFDVISLMRKLTVVDLTFSDLNLDSLNRLFGISSLTTIIANCFDNDGEIFDFVADKEVSTLAWRTIYGFEDDESSGDPIADDEIKHFYEDDVSDKSDNVVIV